MNENKRKILLRFSSELSGNGGFHIPKEELKILKNRGINNIFVEISADDKKDEISSSESFNKIRDLQSLPEEVVEDFLFCKSKLSQSDFSKRILS